MITYLDKTYIKEMQNVHSVFWAKNQATLERTSNNCESFLDKFYDFFVSTHPNIAVFTKNILAM